MFSSWTTFESQLRYVLWRLPWDFLWIGLVLAALGAAVLARRRGAFALAAGLFVVAGLAFATGYQIMDLDAYLLTAVLGLGIFLAAGLARLAERFGSRPAIGIAAALVVLALGTHWRASDESGNRLAAALVTDQLGPLPPRAVLFTTLWDYCQSGSYYAQEVEGFRRDVLVVNPEMLRHPWYLAELERRAPELVRRPAAAFAAFRAALVPVERGLPFSGSATEHAYRAYVNDFIIAARRDREVFVTSRFDALGSEWHRAPYHLAYRLGTDTAYVPEPEWTYAHRPWNARMDGYVAMTGWLYGEARADRAEYEARHGRHVRAVELLRSAARFDPGIRPGEVGPLPLGTERIVLDAAAFFRDLRQRLGGAGG